MGFAFGLTLLAGLSTGFGSLAALFSRRTNKAFLCAALGFSAGVMVYVSTIEIYAKARLALTGELGLRAGSWATSGAFFAGILLILLIDRLIPSYENPHETHGVEEIWNGTPAGHQDEKLMRMGIMTALAIGIHNFPEGLATFVSALQDPGLGLSVAVAIAIHNVPEGIAVSVAIFYGSGDRRKAFLYSLFSGFAEPVGALVGWLVLMPFMSPLVFGVLFAAVGGIMVFISLDQLLPAAEKYGFHHLAIYGLISGMALMAVSLLLFL
ncbi:MAG: zinc transporter ZupT [Synergistaceae bacterium]|nr:zinc transporter ZupT [Synergistaceae bacterium]